MLFDPPSDRIGKHTKIMAWTLTFGELIGLTFLYFTFPLLILPLALVLVFFFKFFI